jgi:hypothetical protein
MAPKGVRGVAVHKGIIANPRRAVVTMHKKPLTLLLFSLFSSPTP